MEIENYILNLKSKIRISPTILRFSTAFGLSPRMRFDLTINQFTKSIYQKESLLVFDAETWRPYCHVNDFALALEKVIESDKKLTDFEIFNVGGEKNNYTKKQITELILKQLPHSNKVSFTNKKFDPRNYRVNFSKESLTKLKTDNEFISRINHQKWIIRANMNIFKRAIVVNKELQEMIANEINN